MFTDMVGYSALSQSNESQALEVLQRHNVLLRPIFPKFNGKEIKAIGDSFLVEFDSALDALNCAIEIQSFLHEYNASSSDQWRINLRVGIHLGDVIHRDLDMFGDAVNIASRIEPLAEPQGICISQQMYDQVRNKIPLSLVKLEHRELKNIKSPIDIYKVMMPWEKDAMAKDQGYPSNRIAIMPFASLSPDPNDEFFADGVTEEIISTVSGISGLSVISRTSVVGYKGTRKKVKEIGGELEVGSLLEGSFRKAGNRIRVTTQLIDVGTDEHLWSQTYDRELNDVFAVQSDIAMQVANTLRVIIKPQEKHTIEERPTTSAEAYSQYLKGMFHVNKWEKTPLFIAIKHFEKALELDPTYALAYCGLSTAYSKLAYLDILEPISTYEKSESYARKALELNENLAEAHSALAHSLLHKYDFQGALIELKKGIQLKPNLADAYASLASTHAFMSEWGECIKAVEKLLELDPFSVESSQTAGCWYLYSEQYDKAIKHFKDSLELDPSNSFVIGNLGLAYIQTGRLEEGLAEVKHASDLSGMLSSDLVYAYVKSGKLEEARKVADELQTPREGKHLPATQIAGAYAALDEKEKALDWLERAYEERSGYLVSINGDFVFENIRNEPRFKAVLRKMGLEPH